MYGLVVTKRRKQIAFSLSDKHIKLLKEKAEAEQISVSSYIRRTLVLYLDDELVDRKVLTEVLSAQKFKDLPGYMG